MAKAPKEAELLGVATPERVTVCGKELLLREWSRAEHAYYQELGERYGVKREFKTLTDLQRRRALGKFDSKALQIRQKKLERKQAQYQALLTKLEDLEYDFSDEDERRLEALAGEIDAESAELSQETDPLTDEMLAIYEEANDKTDAIMALMDKANLAMCLALSEDVPNRLALAATDKERKSILAATGEDELDTFFAQAKASDIDAAEKVVEEGSKFFTSRLNRKLRRQNPTN